MASKRRHVNTSTDFLARHPFVAPVEHMKRDHLHWKVGGEGYSIDIDDAITEADIDLLEWLIKHGKPQRLRDGKIAFAFSLYRASTAIGQGRGRIIERIERRMKTLIEVRDGDWRLKAQMFGPTLHNEKNGRYVVTLTPEFVALLEHGLLVHYADLVDDILPISSAVVRRIVRRTLSHDHRKPESIERILDDIRCGDTATTPDSRRVIRDRAFKDIVAAGDYLTAVFDIRFALLADGRLAIQYDRDASDRRIWMKRGPNNREPRAEQPGTAAEQMGTASRTSRNCA